MHVKTTSHLSAPTAQRSASLDRLARSVVDVGAAPAVVCAAAFRREDGWKFSEGAAGTLWPISSAPVTPDVVFDLASLTKPVIAIAAATESGPCGSIWGCALKEFLHEAQDAGVGSATIERLLSHRAGLAPHIELFRPWRSGRRSTISALLRDAANADRGSGLEQVASAPPTYSDLGYILAGAAIERHTGMSLDAWLALTVPSLVASDLGSVRWWMARESTFLSRCAPTEVVPWRGGLVWGRVHDENAWVLGGLGLCGHAGLFGTALAVARFGAAVLDALQGRSSDVTERAAQLTTRVRNGGTLRAGFDGKSDEGSTAGASASSDAFGHLGFTGTSFWCDPTRSLVVVVLTNRVCPTRANVALRGLRTQLHEYLFSWAESSQCDRPT